VARQTAPEALIALEFRGHPFHDQQSTAACHRATARTQRRRSLGVNAGQPSAAAIGRSFGLSRAPATRIVRTGNDAKQPG
jgi:hypothetical protein